MDSRDPWDSVHDDNSFNYRPENSKYYLGFDASEPWSYETVPMASIKLQHSKDLKNSLPLCDWCYPLVSKDIKTGEYCGRDFPARLFSVVTGTEVDADGLEKYGERITNMLRAIMVTEGRTENDDTIDDLKFKEEHPVGVRGARGKKAMVDKEKFEHAKRRFYKLRGWEVETGRPTAEKFDELGLRDVREKLEKMELLP